MRQDGDDPPIDPTQFYSEFVRRPVSVAIYAAVIVITVLVFALDLPYEVLFPVGFIAMIAIGVAHVRFVRSKGITATKSDEGTLYEMAGRRWFEPKAYFLRVAIFLMISTVGVLAILVITGDAMVAGILVAIMALVWALLIRKGVGRA